MDPAEAAAVIAYQETCLTNQAKTIWQHREAEARLRQKLEYSEGIVTRVQQEEIERLRQQVDAALLYGNKVQEWAEESDAKIVQLRADLEHWRDEAARRDDEAEALHVAVHELEEQVNAEQERTQEAWSAGFEAGRGYPHAGVIPDGPADIVRP
jgi:hypothetical protein